MKLTFSTSERKSLNINTATPSKIDASLNQIFQIHFKSYQIIDSQVLQNEATVHFQDGVGPKEQNLSIKGHTLAAKFSYEKIAGEFQITGLSEKGLEALNIDISKDIIQITATHDFDVKTCIVTCGDGTQGSPCATCKADDGTLFKVCC